MPDSKLVMFGKPAVGAAVMVAAPLAALDIPLKVLVWEDRNGAVSVSYNSPGFLAGRHRGPTPASRAADLITAAARNRRPGPVGRQGVEP